MSTDGYCPLVHTRPSGLDDDVLIVEIAHADVSRTQQDQFFILLKCLNLDGDDPGTGPGVFVDFVRRDDVDRVISIASSIAPRPIRAY